MPALNVLLQKLGLRGRVSSDIFWTCDFFVEAHVKKERERKEEVEERCVKMCCPFLTIKT